MKVLDCTLRDGGYYNQWDFDTILSHEYFRAIDNLPIDYVEIGYRNKLSSPYLGQFYYCPVSTINKIKSWTSKPLAIMLDEKKYSDQDLDQLLLPCRGLIKMVRMAVKPENIETAILMAAKIRGYGFEVALNIMYMSKWIHDDIFVEKLKNIDGKVDYLYLVDSYGSAYPDDVETTFHSLSSGTSLKLGFHGHNNIELALSNSLAALKSGATIIDSTITGMGRGAGNLKTELILTVLDARGEIDFDYSPLADIVGKFENMQCRYRWGTNLPYMVSGANSLPQNDVMDWMGKRYYSLNTIVRALENQKVGIEDNKYFEKFIPKVQFSTAIIIGGGKNAVSHAEAIVELANLDSTNNCIIHASSKNAEHFNGVSVSRYFCLVGNEGKRLEATFQNIEDFDSICVLPPFPRKMGTYIPDEVHRFSQELVAVTFTKLVQDAHTTLAIQTAIDLGVKNIFLVGYDGYQESSMNDREKGLFIENESLFEDAISYGLKLTSLTPTMYTVPKVSSVYGMLIERENNA